MPFRQNRRRLVLSDESLGVDAADSSRSRRSADAARASYPAAVERVQEHRVLDLLPTRYRSLTLLLAAGVAAIAGLELVYRSMPDLTRLMGVDQLAAIDLASGRSVAHWFSSCLLGVTGLIALVIYALRRHRVDDYHGRYRLWLWTVAALMLMSVDAISQLHQLGPAALSWAAAQCSIGQAQLWAGVLGGTAGILVLRLLFEMRRSKGAVATFLLACTCLGGASSLDHGWIVLQREGTPLVTATQAVMIQSGLLMFGHLLLLMAITLYAGYVVRDAAGLVPVRTAKAKRRKAPKPERTKAAPATVQADGPQKPQPHFSLNSDLKSAPSPASEARNAAPAAKPAAVAAKASPLAARVDAVAQDTRGMTRAERKKLRRQARQGQDDDDSDD